MLGRVRGHEAQASPKGERDDEPDDREPARAVAVGEGAGRGGEEGRHDDGEEDEPGSRRVPAEDALDEEGEDAVEGGRFGALDHASPESGEEAAGCEEGEDWWVFASRRVYLLGFLGWLFGFFVVRCFFSLLLGRHLVQRSIRFNHVG